MKRILVARSSMPALSEYVDEIRSLWDSHWLTNMGEKHEQFAKELKDYLSVPYISLFCNGHMGLELLIQAMDFPAGSEIITTPFTFASTTHAIVRNNLVPVFCDIREDNFTIDSCKIEECITEKTVAILPVHVYGNVCDVEGIERIAIKYGLKVLYDAAHAFGVRYKEKGIGNYGDASMFSFHATKVFNSIEGGGVTFKEERIGKRLYQLKNFGIRSEEIIDAVGANGKMNEFVAAMGICNLRHIDEEIEKRKHVYERYVKNLKGVNGIKIPIQNTDALPNFAYFPIVFEGYRFDRNEIYESLRNENIYVRKYFYPLTNEFECYKKLFDTKQIPIAHNISNHVLTLPMYADLDFTDVDKICDIILGKGRA